jgi:non-ribosomal peptide synthetase component F/acyl carrier protein
VLRTDLSGDPSFSELLGRVRATALAAFEHQDLPLEAALAAAPAKRDAARAPAFQTMFLLQNLPVQQLEFAGLQLRLLDWEDSAEAGTAVYELCLVLREREGGLEAGLSYVTNLFDAATIRRILGHYQRLLEAAVSRPETRLSELPLLGEEELGQLLEWSRAAAAALDLSTMGECGDAAALAGRVERVHVLDRQLRPAPIGVAGELYLGGSGLEGPPDRMVASPVVAGSAERLYRARTRARFLADGRLEILERAAAAQGAVEPARDAAPAAAIAPSSEQATEPPSELELQLAALWAEMLGLDEVGTGDNFFELGGHSLLLAQVVQRVHDLFQVEVPLLELYEEPTVARLALVIEELLLDELDRQQPDEP